MTPTIELIAAAVGTAGDVRHKVKVRLCKPPPTRFHLWVGLNLLLSNLFDRTAHDFMTFRPSGDLEAYARALPARRESLPRTRAFTHSAVPYAQVSVVEVYSDPAYRCWELVASLPF